MDDVSILVQNIVRDIAERLNQRDLRAAAERYRDACVRTLDS